MQEERHVEQASDAARHAGTDVVGDLVDAKDHRRAFVGHPADAGFLEDQADLAADQAGDIAAVRQVLQVGLGAERRAPRLGIVEPGPLHALRRAADLARQDEIANRRDERSHRRRAAQRRPVGADTEVELLRRVDAVDGDGERAELREAPQIVAAGRVRPASRARHVAPRRARQQVEFAGVAGEHLRGAGGAAEPRRTLGARGKRTRDARQLVQRPVALLGRHDIECLTRPLAKRRHVGAPLGERDHCHDPTSFILRSQAARSARPGSGRASKPGAGTGRSGAAKPARSESRAKDGIAKRIVLLHGSIA
jgi:hypothetical protein